MMKRTLPTQTPARAGRMGRGRGVVASVVAAVAVLVAGRAGAAASAAVRFHLEVQPLLTKYCYDCHGDGMDKGQVTFDGFKSDAELVGRHDLWLAVLKNVRAGMMPPEKKPHPTAAEIQVLEHWIKSGSFNIDVRNPDPGRVTVRRLNRTEYRNTVRDLLGVEYDTDQEFPPDDTGHGFDNIGDVLTLSPMLMEKYLDAAKAVVGKAVPRVSGVVAEKSLPGSSFRRAGGVVTNTTPAVMTAGATTNSPSLALSYYQATTATAACEIATAGRYQIVWDGAAIERYVENVFDYNKCRLILKLDGQEVHRQDFVREGAKPLHYVFEREWSAGPHELTAEIEPLTPDQKQIRNLTIRIDTVKLRGPMDEKYYVQPPNYARFFPKPVPFTAPAKKIYARELLGPFVQRAFRGPVDAKTIDRLAGLAESLYSQPKQTFEAGVSQAMVAVLASPRFLFREERSEAGVGGRGPFALVDEYSLASRLSYFLWSSMPDDELFKLAAAGKLRQNLPAQVKRMLAHPRAAALTENFIGQWLQARDIETVQIVAQAVLARDDGSAGGNGGRRGGGNFGFNRPRADLDADLRKTMRRETEMYFGAVVKEDRSVLELLESDYTFLNERLARHYGLTNLNVTGSEMRRVTLPPDSPRGGVLTQGTVLAVTSNPTRTSPVKRGLFILDNILGTPPPPPPPDIPPLEDAGKEVKDRTPTLRETLALHRGKPVCASCHNRMDPLGLALENFNAMGMFRQKELNQPVEVAGRLITGESFADIRELKHVLATQHRLDFYRTLTEKLLTYALGRGLEYYDVETVDQIVSRLDRENGRFSALLLGIIESAPFEKRRTSNVPDPEPAGRGQTPQQRAELRTDLKKSP